MAIFFKCPSCTQPIQVDEQCGGQSVGCPYCKRVVTAPQSSTWPTGAVPEASPAPSALSPPPPPKSYAHARPAIAIASRNAAWGLTLALTCAVLCVLAVVVWLGQLMLPVAEKLANNPNPTPQEIHQAYQEMFQEMLAQGRAPTNTFSTSAAVVGVLCGLGGLVLGVRSILRQERRRGMAIASCVISACFVVCQMPVLATGCLPVQARDGKRTTQPAPTPAEPPSPSR